MKESAKLTDEQVSKIVGHWRGEEWQRFKEIAEKAYKQGREDMLRGLELWVNGSGGSIPGFVLKEKADEKLG